MVTMGLASIGLVLHFLSSILAPFALAVFAKIILDPIIQGMRKKGLPRPVAIAVTFLVSGLIVVVITGIVASSISQLTDHVDEYIARFQELMWDLLYSIPDKVGEKLNLDEIFILTISSLKNMVGYFTSGIISLLGQCLVTGLFLIFFLLAETKDHEKSALVLKIEQQVRDYMLVKVGLSAITAVLVGVLLALGQVELSLVFALLTFVLNFVPNIGSILAVALPIPVLILSPNINLGSGVGILVGMIVVQFIVGNFMEPKLIGNKLALDPILVLFSLLLWGAIWGIVGALLAIPLTAALKLALEDMAKSSQSELVIVGQPDQLSRATVVLQEYKPDAEDEADPGS